MKPIGIAILAAALLALTATPGLAQYVVSAKSGTVNLTEGQVELDGHSVESSLTHYPDIKEGSVLSTEEGRAEVLLTPGVTLRLGDHASLKMITNRLIDTRLELLGGSAVVEADQIDNDTAVTIVVKNAAVSLPKAGIYRFTYSPAQVRVFKGEAAVLGGSETTVGQQTTLVGVGRTCALGDTTAAVKKFDSGDTDELDNWSRRRGELMAMANVSGANSFNSNGGLYGAGYAAGMGMPFMGCSGFGFAPSFGFGPAFGYSPAMWGLLNPYAYQLSGMWSYNPWYSMFTYMPCFGGIYSPYGYAYSSPPAVQQGPKRGPTHGPTHGPVAIAGHAPVPAHAPLSLAGRVPLALAVNGSHTPGFRGGTGAAFAAPGHGGFAGYGGSGGGGGSAARGGGSSGGGGFTGGGSTASAASSGGGVSHGGGGFAGGGGAPSGGGGGGHR
ncbi:MAG: hypothetical protein WBL61_08420 [Bryobacteraceae bacterium]